VNTGCNEWLTRESANEYKPVYLPVLALEEIISTVIDEFLDAWCRRELKTP
jgi:hypothetical protein